MPQKEKSDTAKLQEELQIARGALEQLTSVLEDSLHLWRSLRKSFFAGIASGLGFFIGGTVVVGIGIWLTSKVLMQIPVLGVLFQSFGDFFAQDNLKVLQTGTFIESMDKFFETFKTNLLNLP